MQQQTQTTAKKTILLIDNDKAFLEGKSEILEIAGYNVLTASTTAEAREIIQDQYPNLVLLDIRLINDDEPRDESGLGFAYYLHNQGIPFIIVTGYPALGIARQTLLSDDLHGPLAIDFLGKDESNEKLLQSIERALMKAVIPQIKETGAPETTFLPKIGQKAMALEETAGGPKLSLLIALIALLILAVAGFAGIFTGDPIWLIVLLISGLVAALAFYWAIFSPSF